ncbi:FecR domain-containing protein [Sphingomonas sp. PL-96]|uniref:FecR family protein n=1 Tax=Sphingomonas sp. PL-96 TaxID=2887201 RepID=UPI001E33A8BA|nr:FecR domain-containing protein [Sphingomonas sp. PL-96]MCC2977126.1 FecR domain-containing protein [Sphingomonas sp. PL-96]
MPDAARLRREAAAWLARRNGPDGDQHRAAFDDWRAASPAHAEAMARVERHWRTSAIIAQSPLAQGRRLPRPWWSSAAFRRGSLAFGGVATALVVASISLPPASPPLEMKEIASASGQLRTLDLPDGTRVTLDTDSSIRTVFDADARRVILQRGRARFSVAPDRRRFVVAAGDLLVFDRGTVFDVSAASGRVEVMLIEGAVEVRARKPGALPRPVVLAPGEQVTIGVPGAPPARAVLERAGAASWTSGMLAYDAAPLGEVVAEANRYSHTTLVLADPRLGMYRVTGSFKAGRPEVLADSLRAMFGLRREVRSDGAILLLPPPRENHPREGG